MKGSMKYWGLLPQLPSEVSVPSKTSQPSGHPVCLHILHSGDDTALCSSTSSFWMVLMDGPVTPTPGSQLCPLPPWKVVSLYEPSPGHGGRISEMSVISLLNASNSLNPAALLSPLPHGGLFSTWHSEKSCSEEVNIESCPASSHSPPAVALQLRSHLPLPTDSPFQSKIR